jgi:capsular exopolysaccharide synthesis family protein
MISASAVNETEIFKVTVTSPDPEEAERLASAIAYILPKRIATIIDGTSARVADAAIVPSSPSSPSYTNNTFIGFLLGALLAIGVIALREVFDTTIRVEGDISQSCKYPILAAVPDMTAPSKGSAYYGSSRNKKRKYAAATQQAKHGILGPNISFAASEAYKLLRTKLQFSFADDHDCHIIGLSSALSGEGKSLTAVNLAYTLSQLDKKVLLVDCDMRRPTLAEKLGIKKYPGLSNYLTRQSKLEDLAQVCELKAGENAFHVITAGQNPPNPVELLSSSRMKKALDQLRQIYDYVILDLPPVGEVSDAMTASQYTDGILLVVRQNYCDRNVLSETVQQFDFVNAKTLGVVFNCTSESSGKGYYKKYYKRYYYRYGRSYGKSYEHNDRKVQESGAKK